MTKWHKIVIGPLFVAPSGDSIPHVNIENESTYFIL